MRCLNVKIVCSESERLIHSLKTVRQAWNEISKIQFNRTDFSLKKLHHKVYRKIRKEIPELPSQMVIKCEQDVISAYHSAKSNKHKKTKPFVKNSLSLRLDKRLCSFRDGGITITAIGGKRVFANFVSYPHLTEFFARYKANDPLLFVRNGELFLSIPFDVPEPPLQASQLCIGVDLGIKRGTVTSEGKFIRRSKLNRIARKHQFLKAALQAKKTNAARKKLKRMARKQRNISKQFTHETVNAILKTPADTIVIEGLRSLKTKNRGTFLNRLFSQWALGEFRTILGYKAQALGKRVVTVKPAFTSQEDWRGIPSGKRQGCRYSASDKKQWDADWNASFNIARRANIPISHAPVLDGQAPVNEPIAFKSCGHIAYESCKPRISIRGS